MTNNIAISPEVHIFALSSRAFNSIEYNKVIRFSIFFILAVFVLTNDNFAVTSNAWGRKDSIKIFKVEKEKPVYQTIRLSSSVPKIDGHLNDNCWFSL